MISLRRNTMYNKNNPGNLLSNHTAFLSCIVVVLLCCFSFQVKASEADPKLTTEESASSTEETKSTFDYILENREDPFVPFISERAATTKSIDMNEIVEANATLTGMQLFEPGQLTLVALLNNGTEDIAMVEDFTGKGYILTEGTLIGRRGVVKAIAPNNVIIEETAVTRAGKKIITEIVMILKKEGEE